MSTWSCLIQSLFLSSLDCHPGDTVSVFLRFLLLFLILLQALLEFFSIILMFSDMGDPFGNNGLIPSVFDSSSDIFNTFICLIRVDFIRTNLVVNLQKKVDAFKIGSQNSAIVF